MSDNLINLIKSALFLEAVTVATDGGDISPTIIQPAQMTGQDKYNLDQRDSLSVLLFSDLGTITAGATITAKYYARFPNATTDSKLLSTEVITAPAITVGDHYAARFTGENLVNCDADYFTITVVLKQAVGSAYTVSGQVTVKKKIDDEPLTNQPIPTTSTVGYRGQVIFDTDGNKWECINIPMNTWNNTDSYIWATQSYLTTPTAKYYCSGLEKLIYGIAINGTTGSSAITSVAHGITNFMSHLGQLSGGFLVNGLYYINFPYYSTTTSYCSFFTSADNLSIVVGGAYYNKNFNFTLTYYKTTVV